MTAAAEIASHVALSDGFSLLIVVCQGHDQRDELLRETLDAIGSDAAIWVSPREGEDWPSLLLGDIEGASRRRAELLVIDASEAHPFERSGWVRVLRRLNEGRDRIAAHFRGAVALAIPPWLFRILPYEAPDLWSVRSAVARGEEREQPPFSHTTSQWRIRRLLGRLTPRLTISRTFSDYYQHLVGEVDLGSRGASELSSFVLDALRPHLSEANPDTLAAVQLLLVLAHSRGYEESSAPLLYEAQKTLRRLNDSAPFDLQEQILRIQITSRIIFGDSGGSELEDTLRRMGQDLDRWGPLPSDGLLGLSLRATSHIQAFNLVMEALEQIEAAKHRKAPWADQRMPEALWVLADHSHPAKDLRNQAIVRVRSLAKRDPAVRRDLPLWLAEAASLHEDPTERLSDLIEALWLAAEPPYPDPAELREVLLPQPALPTPLRSRAVREIDAISARIGAEEPLSGLLGDVKRGLCGERPEQTDPP